MMAVQKDDLTIPDFLRRKQTKETSLADWKPKERQIIFNPYVKEPPKVRQRDPNAEPVDIQRRIREKNSRVIAEINGLLDDGIIDQGWSLYDFLRKMQATPLMAKAIADHFRPQADELLTALVDGMEGFELDSEEYFQDQACILQSLVDEGERYATMNKKLRVRKKKLPSIERVLKYFVYAKDNPTFQITSIDPAKILGAQELWTFNPKGNILTVYRALDRGGLGINRSKITNIDEAQSFSKRIGRKTQDRINDVISGGKITLRKLMDQINGDKIKVTRITKFTVLLRVG